MVVPFSFLGRVFRLGNPVLLTALLLSGSGCGLRQPNRAYGVEINTEPDAAYRVVKDTLVGIGYHITNQDDAARSIRVRTHVDEHSQSRRTYILVEVDGTGRVHLRPSGYLVLNHGAELHHALAKELTRLERLLTQGIENYRTREAEPAPNQMATETASRGAVPLPRAWTEPTRDPSKWGAGDVTCVPVHLPDQGTPVLQLRLSTGEDVSNGVRVQYAPELCQSVANCTAVNGCPALGLADPERARQLAEAISSGTLKSEATLVHESKQVAIVELDKLGPVAEALKQIRERQGAQQF